jgi:hypothetical protein
MQHAGSASRASVLRRRGAGTLLAFGDHSAALAPRRSGKSRPSHVGWRETTDQLRTTTAELSAHQRSTVDATEHWFTLDNRCGPIWGSRGREFKSRQPDERNTLSEQV